MTSTEIFVFGSNTQGLHGAGAAAHAVKHHGAIFGQPRGLQGRSYAIVTKDLAKGRCSVTLASVEDQVNGLRAFSRQHPDWRFRITAIGCGLAGFLPSQIAPFFNPPEPNWVLPLEFQEQQP